MIGKKVEKFEIVLNEKYQLNDILGIKYKIISEPIQVEDGWEYTIEKI